MGFAEFIRERQYLQNVSPATLDWYKESFKQLRSESPTGEDLKDAVLRMRERGRKATGCNSALRAINAYLKWSGSQLKVPKLKEPSLVLPTFTARQVSLLVGHKPKNFYQRRLHLIVLALLDTGARITEVLTLRTADVDLDNLLVTLDGKGRKVRTVPFSFELRKALYRYVQDFKRRPDCLLFATRTETKVARRVVLRDVKRLCRRLGFEPPPRTLHACRHSFATNYLRRGGSALHLQKVLGHSDLQMTKRYVSLQTEDLSAIHERVSLLSR